MLRRANAYYDHEEWRSAFQLYMRLVDTDDGDHWLMARVSSCYYEQRDYQRAVEWARRAVAERGSCPLAQWHLANALDGVGCSEDAADAFRALIDRGWRRIAEGRCGEGEAWAKALVNDCRLRLAQIAASQGGHRDAVRWGRLHLRLRNSQRLDSIYDVTMCIDLINRSVVLIAAE